MTEVSQLVLLRPAGEQVYAKLEYGHASGSAKHRSMPAAIDKILAAQGDPGGRTLLIRSAGAAAITAAFVGAQRGLNVHAVLPVGASSYVVNALRWYGATCERVPVDRAAHRMRQLSDDPKYIVLDQAGDERFVEGYLQVGKEIVQQLPDVEAVVVGLGTGLTSMGIVRGLRVLGCAARVYGVEPSEAAISAGRPWAPHHIPGLSPPLPRPLLRTELLADVIAIPSAAAWKSAREVAGRDGLPLGPSSGAAVAAAHHIRAAGLRGPIVAVCPCSIDAYLEQWEHGEPDATPAAGGDTAVAVT